MRYIKRTLFSILLAVSVIVSGCGSEQTAAKSSYEETSYNWLSEIPEYSGDPYVVVNNNKPFFTKKDKKNTKAFEQYTNLDALGRCGVAYANICKEIMPTEKRGAIGSVKPSGWHTVKYNGYIEGNYLYNRCHLIGYQLSGENANERNLITGTRYMNCDGQLPFENMVNDYVDETNNHVLYRVTPIFENKNLVANGVLMEAYSVEDNGKGCQFCIYCYNVQPGIAIDYKTGDSHMIEDYTGEYATSSYYSENKRNEQSQGAYVLNTKSKKFHKPSCSSVKRMSSKNKKSVNTARKDLISDGYSPCGICNP